jgi:hypothetical protein
MNVDLRRLRTLNAPPLRDLPAGVADAVRLQDEAIARLFDVVDDHDLVLRDDWEQAAEARMMIAAAAGERVADLVSAARVERASALADAHDAEVEVTRTAAAAREAVGAWILESGLEQARQTEQQARKAEEDALEAFQAARTAWLKSAAARQWTQAVAGSGRPSGIPDFHGSVVSAGGGSVMQHQLDQMTEHMRAEHRRADAGADRIGGAREVVVVGASGVEQSILATTARALLDTKDSTVEVVAGQLDDDDDEVEASLRPAGA